MRTRIGCSFCADNNVGLLDLDLDLDLGAIVLENQVEGSSRVESRSSTRKGWGAERHRRAVVGLEASNTSPVVQGLAPVTFECHATTSGMTVQHTHAPCFLSHLFF